MKVRAALAEAPGRPLSITEIDLDPPRQGEVLVRLHATGVCHTDQYTLSGVDPSGLFPTVLGHEGGGEVVELGPGVQSLSVGDHVIPLYIPECGRCKHCLSSETNLCLAIRETQGKGLMPDGTTRIHHGPGHTPVHHYMGTSTFAEYTVVPEIALARIRKDAPLDKVCLIGCGVTTGVGAVLYTAKVRRGATTAVFGCGGVGLNVVQGCVLAGAERIIALDRSEMRLSLARSLGATDTILVGGDDPVQAVLDLTSGYGVDYSFEATGNVKVMRQALESCHMGGGQCTLIGVAGRGEELSVVPRFLITGRHLTGSAFGGAKSRRQVPELVDWYMEGKLKIDSLCTAFLPLQRINEAFTLMERQEGIRTVITF